MRDRMTAAMGGLGLLALLAGAAVSGAEGQASRPALYLWIAGGLLVALFLVLGWAQVVAFLGRRSTRYGGHAALATLFLIGILAAVNFVAARHHWRADLTHAKFYSLSDQTRKVVQGLPRDVQAVGFFKKEDPARGALQDLLGEYAYLSPRLRMEYVDPDQDPRRAREYQIEALQTLVLASGDKVERLTTLTEEAITNALVRVTREGRKVAYVLEGHGERIVSDAEARGLSVFKEALAAENYEVRPLLLMTLEAVPPDCALLVIASPEKPLLPNERAALDSYLRAGGRALCLLDPGRDGGLADFLLPWGVRLNDDLVYDANPASRFLGAGEMLPLVLDYEDHPITRGFRLATLYREARTLEPAEGLHGGTVTGLARTSRESFALQGPIHAGRRIDPKTDRGGPLTLALAVETPAEPDTGEAAGARGQGRLVVIGDADIATNQYIGVQGNRDLLLNTANWLAGEESLISIRARHPEDRRVNLTRRQDRLVFYGVQILLPMMVLAAGVVVWWRRR